MSTSFRRFHSPFTPHRSSLTTHRSIRLMSNPFGGIGAICVSKTNLNSHSSSTALPVKDIFYSRCSISASAHAVYLLAIRQCGAPIKSLHCIRSRTALSLSSHRIDFAHAPHCVFEGALNIVSRYNRMYPLNCRNNNPRIGLLTILGFGHDLLNFS